MNVLRDATNYVTGALGLGSSGETSGALDIMVVQHEDGAMSCTPFHVRFSKVHPTNRKERVIQLRVNGRTVPLCMKLGAAGEAFFVERVHNALRRDLVTSPLTSPVNDGDGEEGRRQWGKAAGQDDWKSRQILDYQLLSDLSSDDEAASNRDSNRLLASHVLSTSSSPSPSLSPRLLRLSGSPQVGSGGDGDSTSPYDAIVQLDRKRNEVAPTEVVPIPDVGTNETSIPRTGAGSSSNDSNRLRDLHGVSATTATVTARGVAEAVVRAASDSTSAAGVAVGDEPAVFDAAGSSAETNDGRSSSSRKRTKRGSLWGVSDGEGGKHGKEEAERQGRECIEGEAGLEEDEDGDCHGGGDDGDEEDNADDAEGYDTAGEGGGGDRIGGGDVSGADLGGEARVGEEGSWWWSWTWGALPVRKKPKSTRRKLHHYARQARIRRGASDSLASGNPAVTEDPRSARASSAVNSESNITEGSLLPPLPLSPQLLAPSAPPGTPFEARDCYWRKAKAWNDAPVRREGQSVLVKDRIAGDEDDDHRRDGSTMTLEAKENGATPPTTLGDAADGSQKAGSGDAPETKGTGGPTRSDDNFRETSSTINSARGGESCLSNPSYLEKVAGTGASAGADAGEGDIHGVATTESSASPMPVIATEREEKGVLGTPFPVVKPRSEGKGRLVTQPDVVTTDKSLQLFAVVAGDEVDPSYSSTSAAGGSAGFASIAVNPSREEASERERPILPQATAVATVLAKDEENWALPGTTTVPCQNSNTLALVHLLLNDCRDSGSPKMRVRGHDRDQSKYVEDGERPLPPQTSWETNGNAGVETAHATVEERKELTEGVSPPPPNPAGMFPDDDNFVMNETVIAVETLSRLDEAWLYDGPAAAAAAVTGDDAGPNFDAPPPLLRLPPSPRSPLSALVRDDIERSPGGGREDSSQSTIRTEEHHVAFHSDVGNGRVAGELLPPGTGSGYTPQHQVGKSCFSGVAPPPLLPGTPVADEKGTTFRASLLPAGGAAPPRPVSLPPIVTSGPDSFSGSCADSHAFGEISGRIGSIIDLRGFHTPHGGSSQDLTALISERRGSAPEDAGSAPHDRICAAVGQGFDFHARVASPALASSGTEDGDAIVIADGDVITQIEGGMTREGDALGRCTVVVPDESSNEAYVGVRAGEVEGEHSESVAAAAGERTATEAPSRERDVGREKEKQPLEGSSREVGGGRMLMRKAWTPTSALADPEKVGGRDEGFLTATASSVRKIGGKVANRVASASMSASSVAAGRGVCSSPVLSLSGHLIGPDAGLSGEAEGWVRDTFAREAVTWDDFVRYPQEILQDPRLLVAMEGCLMNLSEALPHLVAASVFGNSLVARASPKGDSVAFSVAKGGDGGVSVSVGRKGGGECADSDGNGGDNGSVFPIRVTIDEGGHTARDIVSRDGFGDGDSDGGGASTAVGPMMEEASALAPPAPESAPDAAEGVAAEDEAAAGSLWGLSGWFSRRSSMPPMPPQAVGTVSSASPDGTGTLGVVDSEIKATGGDRGDGAAAPGRPLVREEEMVAAVQRGAFTPVPTALSMDPAEQERRHDDDAYATDTDEDGDVYGKTLRPTSEQLAALRLRAGCNTVEFVVKLAGQAERVVAARVFLWRSGAKVVVSDVENTIARSGGDSGMGSFTQVVGPGVHKDVSNLLSKITRNGYKILYLTNRPLPDWHARKGGVDGALPRGPVLCPPEVLFRGTSSSKDRRSHQEVFKMTALRGLKLIFPADVNPLYAGFGNSVSDMMAFKKMSVPEGRIFLIDSSGELHSINHTYRQTFMSLSLQADLTFPPLPHDGADDSFDGVDNSGGGVPTADVCGGSAAGAPSRMGAVRDGVDGGEEKGSRGFLVESGGGGVTGVPNASDRAAGDDFAEVAGKTAGGRGGMAFSPSSPALSGEKSFYPNRAAVEDQFTDLNFWRDPPPLIGDDDDDDDDYDDEDGEDEEKKEGVFTAGRGLENFT